MDPAGPACGFCFTAGFRYMQWTSWLIVCPMVFLAGFVDAIAGGGGLISLPAYLFAGLPSHAAVATNKLSSTVGTAVSTARYCKNGCVEWKLAIPGIVTALLGAQLGARLALLVDDEVFSIVLLVLLPVIALYVLLRRDLKPRHTSAMPAGKQLVLVSVLTFLTGIYDGFYGPGTGTFLLLIYTALCRMEVLKAAGNVKLSNLASNISALSVFLMNGAVMLPLGLTASVFSVAGHWLGSGIAMKNGTRIVRAVILTVIALLFVKIIIERT